MLLLFFHMSLITITLCEVQKHIIIYHNKNLHCTCLSFVSANHVHPQSLSRVDECYPEMAVSYPSGLLGGQVTDITIKHELIMES